MPIYAVKRSEAASYFVYICTVPAQCVVLSSLSRSPVKRTSNEFFVWIPGQKDWVPSQPTHGVVDGEILVSVILLHKARKKI